MSIEKCYGASPRSMEVHITLSMSSNTSTLILGAVLGQRVANWLLFHWNWHLTAVCLLAIDLTMKAFLDQQEFGISWKGAERLTHLLGLRLWLCLNSMTTRLDEGAKTVSLNSSTEKNHADWSNQGHITDHQSTASWNVRQFTYLRRAIPKDRDAEIDVTLTG